MKGRPATSRTVMEGLLNQQGLGPGLKTGETKATTGQRAVQLIKGQSREVAFPPFSSDD